MVQLSKHDTINVNKKMEVLQVTLEKWFEKGMTFAEYRATMNVNQKETDDVYEQLQFTQEDEQWLEQLATRNLRGVVLTADWCGDAAVNVPIIQRIAEKSNIELRFLVRDDNLELMDQYLTNGTARAIPIFVFFNEEGEETNVWGPRSEEVQQLVASLRGDLPDKEAPDFEEKQQAMYRTFKEKVTTDPSIWRTVIESVKTKLQ